MDSLRRSQPVFGWLGLAAVVIVLFAPQAFGMRPAGLMRDFNAFYCAGAAVDAGADPYLSQPLGACESSPRPRLLHRMPGGLVMPAPLPGYALAPFALIAHLPYPLAVFVWFALLSAAVAATIFAVTKVAPVPLPAAVAALVVGDGYAGIALGQVAVVSIAAIALAAYAFQLRRMTLAAACAALALIEPHLGLPACLALAVCAPRARLPLALALAGCAALSVWTLGLAANIEYVRSVLPLHALAEIGNDRQFSLTYLLHRAGASDSIATAAGSLQYVAFACVGVYLAQRLAERLASPALAVLIPPAVAMIGGSFVHYPQVAAIVPAALVLSAVAPERTRLLGIAIALLAIPWIEFANLGVSLALFAAIAVATIAYELIDRRFIVAAGAGIATFVLAALPFLIWTPMADSAPIPVAANALAEVSWEAYLRDLNGKEAPSSDLARLPTAIGTVLFAIAAIRLRGDSRRRTDRYFIASA
jgi:hypothetical protein